MTHYENRTSNLSGERIRSDSQEVRLVVRAHPALPHGPVELKVLASEIGTIDDDKLHVVIVDVYRPDRTQPERIYLSRTDFDSLAKRGNMAAILASASAPRRGPQSAPANVAHVAAGAGKYADPAHAGTPHRGRVTDAEKEYVSEHLAEVNERLRSQGLREIDPNDPDMMRRYGLSPAPSHVQRSNSDSSD